MNHADGPLSPDNALHADLARLSLLGHDLRAAVSDIIGGLRLIDHHALDRQTNLQLERVRTAGEVLARLMEEAFVEMGAERSMSSAAAQANVQLLRFLYDIEMRWSGRALEKGLTFHIAVAPDVPRVLSLDRVSLERMLANLVSNAIKYTDTGNVRLDVDLCEEGALRFAVRDDGPGFSDAALSRLFERAGRPENANRPGHGLGLHISKAMVEQFDGTINVANLATGGAEVVISLPPKCWASLPQDTETPLPDLSRVKVLVAEDNATNQAIIGKMLAAMGAEFEIAVDGVEALQWLERESFDLLLVDIEMPRLSGIEVIRALRHRTTRHGDMPIIAATAYVLRANRDAIYAAGADAILAKPLPGIEAFGNALAAVLDRAHIAPEDLPHRADDSVELDRARFDRLLEIAGPEGTIDLLDRVSSDLRRAERGLVAALPEHDLASIRADTHVLIALAGAVGAQKLQALAEALNASAHRHEDAAMAQLGQEVLAQLDRLIHFIAQERGTRAERG